MTYRASDPLLSPPQLERFLRQRHLPPLDRFGQHFLVDAGVLQDILTASKTDPEIPVIEVGAGLGVLTRALAREREMRNEKRGMRPAPLVAVELDRRLVPLLVERTREFPSVTVVHADILKVDVEKLVPKVPAPGPMPYDVIGNIPYNITAPILDHFFRAPPRLSRTGAARLVRGPRRATFLVDDSVAAVIAAAPPAMSIRSVGVQVAAVPTIARRRIPPTAFLPPPAVHSAILVLESRPAPLVAAADERAFFRLVRAGFSQKRKMLGNALAARYRLSPEDARAWLRRAGINPQRRAQTLTIDEWKQLLAEGVANP